MTFPAEEGRFFEDFCAGDRYVHWPGRTILDADNTWFTLLTMNSHPVHFDVDFSSGSQFGGILVNSLLTLSIVTGMSVRETSQRAIANLGWDEVRLTAPVFVGDTLYAESEVMSLRRSASRPGEGIVSIRTTGYKCRRESDRESMQSAGDADSGKAAADGKKLEVVTFLRSFLVPCRTQA